MASVSVDRSYDVIIVGGAIMGSAAAYFLAADPAFDGSVLVVERDPTYGESATARSWGGIRQQFSTPENILMSRFGVDFLGRAEALLGADALARRFPWLATDGLAGGGLGLSGEGRFDPASLLHALRRKALALGAAYVADECVGLVRAANRVTGVRLRGGGAIACGTVIDAAGPQAARIAAFAGCALPVRPRKRMTFVFACRTDLGDAPLTIDPSGVAFRPEGDGYIAIVSPPPEDDPDSDDLEPEDDLFEAVIWPALARRVPAFAAIRLTGSWAGHYDVNTLDHNAIIGPHPEIGGLLMCAGFSGHGAQHAPAAGRALAELIVHGGYRSIDLAALSWDRIAAGRPLRERNVV